MKSSRKKIIAAAASIISIIALTVLGIYLKSVADYKKAVKQTSFNEIDISGTPDGIYTGEYDVNFIYAKVEVAVKNGRITNIKILEHKNGRGGPAEAVINKIIEEQKIDVDAVSGATNSSAVIKKAVENALTEQPAQSESQKPD